MVIYYRDHDGELIRGVRDGELTEEELRAVIARGIPILDGYLAAEILTAEARADIFALSLNRVRSTA